MADETKLQARFEKIADGYLKQVWVVPELPKTVITLEAEQAAYLTCYMIMIYVQCVVMHGLSLWWVTTYGAEPALLGQHMGKNFRCNPIQNSTAKPSTVLSILFDLAILLTPASIVLSAVLLLTKQNSLTVLLIISIAFVMACASTGFAVTRHAKSAITGLGKFRE